MLGAQSPLSVDIEVYSGDDREPHLAVGLLRADGTAVYGTTTDIDGAHAVREGTGRYRFRLHFDALILLPGQYTLKLHALDPEGLRLFDTEVRELIIRGESRELGIVRLAHHWE